MLYVCIYRSDCFLSAILGDFMYSVVRVMHTDSEEIETVSVCRENVCTMQDEEAGAGFWLVSEWITALKDIRIIIYEAELDRWSTSYPWGGDPQKKQQKSKTKTTKQTKKNPLSPWQFCLSVSLPPHVCCSCEFKLLIYFFQVSACISSCIMLF